MIEALVVLLLIGCALAAPFIVIMAWVAVIWLTLRTLPYVGWMLLGLVVVTAVAGCAKPAPVVSVQGPVVPPQLLTCKAEPVPPSAVTQRAVATYVLDLADAGDDCRTKLGAVRGIVQ